MTHDGYAMTGRNPAVLTALIARYRDDVWLGPGGDADRGDRHSHKPANRKDTQAVTADKPTAGKTNAETFAEFKAFLAALNKQVQATDAAKSRKTAPTTPAVDPRLKTAVGVIRTVVLGRVAIDPIDRNAPIGTQRRRIAAYNALHDLARPGHDRYCGAEGDGMLGPCVLRSKHNDAMFDDRTYHMDAEQADRAIRYLAHSNPDPAERA